MAGHVQIEERSHRHTRSGKDGSPAENVWIGMDAGDLSRHGFTSPNGMLRVYVCRAPVVILVWQRWRSPAAAFTLLDTAAVGCSACWAACHRRPIQ